MNHRATCILTAGSLLTQGCSLLFVTSPPDTIPEPPPPEITCTSAVVAPVIDTVIGAYQGVRTGVAVAADDSDYEDYPISRPADIALGLGFAALFFGSAVYGYSSTSECSELKDEAARKRVDPAIIPQPATMPPHGACTVDTQCKGDRICENGRCVSPPAPAAPPSAPAPIEPAPAAPAEPAPPLQPEATPAVPPPDPLK